LKKDSVLRECDASLRRLRTDVIDLYQCHWPDPNTPVRETMEAMRTLLDQGKIRAIGLSNYSCEEIAAAREYGPVHCLQPPLSMLHLRAADDLLPFCIEHKMGVICYSPLAKGLLTGKFDTQSKLEGIRARDPDFSGTRLSEHLATMEQLRPIAERYDKTLAQLAINWAIRQPGISAALVGAKRPSQVFENAGGAGWQPSEDDCQLIDEIIGHT
jgi:aryl-alcohol dehydrogenase-like predicted oxidoreductase